MKRLLLLVLLALPLLAEKKPLTLEALNDPKLLVRFGGAAQSGFQWIDDATFLWPRTDAAGDVVEWRVFDTKSGKERPVFDAAKVARALQDAGANADSAKDAARSSSLELNAKKNAVLFDAGDDLYVYSIDRNTATRLTSTPAAEEEATFSPDGKKVAFVRDNNLFVVDLAGRERQITTDGTPDILNGKLDWVYQEEIYGRGIFKGYWWSPDSARIAFLRLDDRDVPKYPIVNDLPYHPDVRWYAYPKAGDPNPKVALKIAPASGGRIVDVDTSAFPSDLLIVRVDWAPDGRLTYEVQNREQSWLDLVAATPQDGKSTTLIHDTTKAWVDPLAEPTWLPDGTFLWQSERTGWQQIYHYKPDGTLLGQVTNGEREVNDVHGTDGQWIYFSAVERFSQGMQVWRIHPDGTGLQRLSTTDGTHNALFNPSRTMYVDSWSDMRTPTQVRVHRSDGRELSVVEKNDVAALREYDLPKPELLQVKTRDGFVMEAVMVRPTNFDPSKKYPVFQILYGGPHAPMVVNSWRGQGLQSLMFLQYVAQQGAIGWMVDNRTASGKGAVSAWPIYKRLGDSELRDLEDATAWLKSQPYVDGNRFALFGWSYGGFMVSYALTHSTSFAAGIAGGSVTDWRDYDSIYTERILGLPQNNADGYRKSSPRFDAKDLHGDLLLIHGTTDDNVHVQNTYQFARELQQEGKTFQMMLYPGTQHSVYDKRNVLHIHRTIVDFLRARGILQ